MFFIVQFPLCKNVLCGTLTMWAPFLYAYPMHYEVHLDKKEAEVESLDSDSGRPSFQPRAGPSKPLRPSVLGLWDHMTHSPNRVLGTSKGKEEEINTSVFKSVSHRKETAHTLTPAKVKTGFPGKKSLCLKTEGSNGSVGGFASSFP